MSVLRAAAGRWEGAARPCGGSGREPALGYLFLRRSRVWQPWPEAQPAPLCLPGPRVSPACERPSSEPPPVPLHTCAGLERLAAAVVIYVIYVILPRGSTLANRNYYSW